MIGLESELCQLGLINVEWQLYELAGKFYRLPPKDDSYRSVNWAPSIPVNLPPFLDKLIAAQAAKAREEVLVRQSPASPGSRRAAGGRSGSSTGPGDHRPLPGVPALGQVARQRQPRSPQGPRQ
jgi:hypothetical protein